VPSDAALFSLLNVPGFVVPLLLATLLATVFALTVMNVFQRELDPVRAAILYALEPIWTTLIAAALGFGRPGFWLWIGGGALVAGNLIAEGGVAPDD
jgi:drug/metabolite transporter (DMT)-like permease